ncbi:MAG: DUF3575 domain-containing protein [Chitinophagaceae bacterium]|nr:MAG: DUF3575 domain-containing protein [Chitinophagaceae bacterium]
MASFIFKQPIGMRTLFLILILVLLTISNIFSQTAQEAHTSAIVKWAPATLAAGKLTAGSEINFGGKGSLDLVLGFPLSTTRTIKHDEKESELETKAFSVLLGYRHYFGRKQMRGLYLEPYAKYLRHQAEGIISSDLLEELAQMDTKTKYEGFGIGAQLGVQFLIAKRVSIDFYFLGIEANTTNFKTHSVDVANALPWTILQTTEARRQLEETYADVPFVKNKVEIEINQDKKEANSSYKGFLPGLRFGASIGVKF